MQILDLHFIKINIKMRKLKNKKSMIDFFLYGTGFLALCCLRTNRLSLGSRHHDVTSSRNLKAVQLKLCLKAVSVQSVLVLLPSLKQRTSQKRHSSQNVHVEWFGCVDAYRNIQSRAFTWSCGPWCSCSSPCGPTQNPKLEDFLRGSSQWTVIGSLLSNLESIYLFSPKIQNSTR